jgi:hypothetical protein
MTLRDIYDDPKTTTRNPDLLAKRAGTTVKSAKAFLATQSSSVVRTAWHRPSLEQFAPAGGPAGHWQADVLFLDLYKGANDKRRALLLVLNTTTRYAIVRPLLHAKATDTSAAFADLLHSERPKITILRVDSGVEFKQDFAALCEDRGITLQVGEPYTHTWVSRTDRLCRTLRQRIGEHFEREDTHRWIDVLPDIIANYNETPHRTLSEVLGRKACPGDVTAKEEKLIRADELARASNIGRATDAVGIIPGETFVRVLRSKMKGGSSFDKTQLATWSSSSYLVLDRNGVNSFIVAVPAGEVKIWPAHSLLVASPDEVAPTRSTNSGPKVDIAVARAKRLELRNISLEENEAALAAPAAKKRASKPTAKVLAAAADVRPKRVAKAPKRLES